MRARKLLRPILIIATLLSFAPPLSAQNCDTLARYGVYDVKSSSSDTQRAQSFRRFFCQQNFSQLASAQSFGLSFGVLIFSLGFSNTESNFRQTYSSFCDDQQFALNFRSVTEREVKRINPQVQDNIKSCIMRPGDHALIEQGPDPSIRLQPECCRSSVDFDLRRAIRRKQDRDRAGCRMLGAEGCERDQDRHGLDASLWDR